MGRDPTSAPPGLSGMGDEEFAQQLVQAQEMEMRDDAPEEQVGIRVGRLGAEASPDQLSMARFVCPGERVSRARPGGGEDSDSLAAGVTSAIMSELKGVLGEFLSRLERL